MTCAPANFEVAASNSVEDDAFTLKQVLAFQKSWQSLALSLYVFLPTACFHFELLELIHVDFFEALIIGI